MDIVIKGLAEPEFTRVTKQFRKIIQEFSGGASLCVYRFAPKCSSYSPSA
jgi:hypothetical protein